MGVYPLLQIVVRNILLLGNQLKWNEQEYLTEDALAAVKALLPDQAEGDLSNVCFWADEVRHHYHYRWSAPLHYVDTPDFLCNYKYCRDCHDGHGHMDRCVTGAIYNYSMQLSQGYYDLNSEKYNLTEALMFLSHFVGDVHQGSSSVSVVLCFSYESSSRITCIVLGWTRTRRVQIPDKKSYEIVRWTSSNLKLPLHVGFIGDLGGNTIVVRWYRRKTNLHHVWDTMIIESALKTYYKSDIMLMIQALMKNITDGWSDEVPSWEDCPKLVCPDPYASESIHLACKFAYRNATPGSTLTDDYFLSRRPVVEKRLAQSGVRLAEVLNRIFTKKPSVVAQ
ncbi:Endonuclease 4 [Capsicum annuum]|uniref:Aspergillus nuclease S1 n=1 Tax=Capsicum annuum TaxID=4072 RepID=A0A2G3A8J2_CAPAN|nr:Endonuclease 4 [Capsicum annuum]